MTAILHKVRNLGLTLLIAMLVLSAFTRLVSASLSGIAPAAGSREEVALQDGFCAPSEEITHLLEGIADRDRVLSDREKAIAMREQDLIVARQEVEAAIITLNEAQDRLAARMAASNTATETDVTRLVSVYEGMKPKDAAVLFETMDSAFAAGFLSRMAPDAAAALFSNLSPEKAYALSVLMAGRNANAATE